MSRAQQLLSCAITFHGSDVRKDEVKTTFPNMDEALATWSDVLIHEAREAMQQPLEARPDDVYLHPVDIDTDEPGIVDSKDSNHVLRMRREGILV